MYVHTSAVSLVCSCDPTCPYMEDIVYSLEGINQCLQSMFVYIPLPIFSMDLARSLILVSIESGTDVCITSDPYMYVCVVRELTI